MLDFSTLSKHPKPDLTFTYGTAGFRMLATQLDYVVYTVGILAALRSKALGGAAVGVMITASHNPPADNGIKIVDPYGDMLDQTWEPHATRLANAAPGDLAGEVLGLAAALGVDMAIPARVVLARDSRASGVALAAATAEGVAVLGGAVVDFGMMTTPQLHYVTRCTNDASFGAASEAGYLAKVAGAYAALCRLHGLLAPRAVTVDAANGVGAPKLEALAPLLAPHVVLSVVNGAYENGAALNSGCGADYVKTGQRMPEGAGAEGAGATANALYASLDGDADRVVCYYLTAQNQFRLLDGDKIATLLAKFLQETVAQTPLKLRVGVVQTAYANGLATAYAARKLQLPVTCTATGVKHLHHAAKEYDIGVYFEANGHGTVLFSPATLKTLAQFSSSNLEERKRVQTLLLLSDLINQTVGDAIGDLLAIVFLCQVLDKTPEEWDSEYTDLPNRLGKVLVADRAAFTTTDAERKLVTPEGLQQQIEAVYSQYPQGRSFVRASGTEDAVRVYVEAATKADVDVIMEHVMQLVAHAGNPNKDPKE